MKDKSLLKKLKLGAKLIMMLLSMKFLLKRILMLKKLSTSLPKKLLLIKRRLNCKDNYYKAVEAYDFY
jgi:hypothetical protein